MNAKLSVALTKIKYFCATQSLNFYMGAIFTVLGLLTLTAYIPLLVSVILTPLVTFLMYTLGRLVKEPLKILKTANFGQDILAVFLGNLWVLLFVLI